MNKGYPLRYGLAAILAALAASLVALGQKLGWLGAAIAPTAKNGDRDDGDDRRNDGLEGTLGDSENSREPLGLKHPTVELNLVEGTASESDGLSASRGDRPASRNGGYDGDFDDIDSNGSKGSKGSKDGLEGSRNSPKSPRTRAGTIEGTSETRPPEKGPKPADKEPLEKGPKRRYRDAPGESESKGPNSHGWVGGYNPGGIVTLEGLESPDVGRIDRPFDWFGDSLNPQASSAVEPSSDPIPVRRGDRIWNGDKPIEVLVDEIREYENRMRAQGRTSLNLQAKGLSEPSNRHTPLKYGDSRRYKGPRGGIGGVP